MTSSFQRLTAYVATLPIFSAHEHHQPDDYFRDFSLDRILTGSYVNWINPWDGQIPDREVLLDRVRHNAYFVWLQRGLQRIYGIDKLTAANWDAVSKIIQDAHASPTWHLEIFRNYGNYRRAIQDSYWNSGDDLGHPEFFSPTLRINCFVVCHHPEMRDHNGASWAQFNVPALDFDEYLEFIEETVRTRKAAGAVALKSALAYDRDIAFRPRERAEAARVFGKHPTEVSPEDQRAYQDFVYDYLCTLAAKYELPFQNHTGLALIGGSNPLNLEPMIARHPHTRFILFHGGYPWVGEIAGLAHNYRNVYPDLTWLPIISPTAAVRAVHEWLETTWSSRYLCWGGDCWCAEESVGASLAFKHVLATALAQKVDEGYFDMDDAECVARRLCYENGEYVYGI
ncbi:MAG TPA: amidohydrolase family protein [Armatimonadota bacterium]|jgi:hypothetical protein